MQSKSLISQFKTITNIDCNTFDIQAAKEDMKRAAEAMKVRFLIVLCLVPFTTPDTSNLRHVKPQTHQT